MLSSTALSTQIERRSSKLYRIIADHLGSPRVVVDATTGAVVQRLDFDEFGKVLKDTSPGFQPFGFAGGIYDQDTKFVRFGARDYDPAIGRWTSKVPIGFAGGDTNLYRYVLQDPVNLINPYGLEVGFGESLIPVWGSGRQAFEDFAGGRYGWAAFNSAMMVSDAVPIRALAGAVAKVGWRGLAKTWGSHTWGATRSWIYRVGWSDFKGQQFHHWLIPQRWYRGSQLGNALFNQPWNLMAMPSQAFHNAIEGKGEDAMFGVKRLWYGTPHWAKGSLMSLLGRTVNETRTHTTCN